MQCQKLKTYMETGRVVFLPARSIRPNPAQPRKTFRGWAGFGRMERIGRKTTRPVSIYVFSFWQCIARPPSKVKWYHCTVQIPGKPPKTAGQQEES